MRNKMPGWLTVGIAGLAGTGGLGFAVFKMASGHTWTAGTYVALMVSFVVTGLVTALKLVLNYRLGKLTLQAQAAVVERDDNLRRMHLELQRSILDKIHKGTDGAQAYLTMAAAEAITRSAEPVPNWTSRPIPAPSSVQGP
jgi:hypothetical protein